MDYHHTNISGVYLGGGALTPSPLVSISPPPFKVTNQKFSLPDAACPPTCKISTYSPDPFQIYFSAGLGGLTAYQCFQLCVEECGPHYACYVEHLHTYKDGYIVQEVLNNYCGNVTHDLTTPTDTLIT